MSKDFWRRVASSVLLLSILAALRLAEATVRRDEGEPGGMELVLSQLRNTELNTEDRAQQTAGYYEGLLNEGSRVTSMGSRLTGQFNASGDEAEGRRIAALRRPDKYIVTRDFVYYIPKSNIDLPDYDDGQLRLVTNSVGMSDLDYELAAPPRTKRIALLGDSVTRGQGTPFGENYEALLETHLNQAHRSTEVERFEILNFAVSGYRLTQMVDVALEKVPAYHPDLYLLALSELSIAGRWGDHLEQLIAGGVDLKYDFLRNLATRARLAPGDSAALTDAKLTPFRVEVLRWAIETIRDHARRQGATLIVLLVPTVRESDLLQRDFSTVPQLITSLKVPMIDLLDTFSDTTKLIDFRPSKNNVHPNARGHRRLFERLYQKVLGDLELRHAFLESAKQDAHGEPLN